MHEAEPSLTFPTLKLACKVPAHIHMNVATSIGTHELECEAKPLKIAYIIKVPAPICINVQACIGNILEIECEAEPSLTFSMLKLAYRVQASHSYECTGIHRQHT